MVEPQIPGWLAIAEQLRPMLALVLIPALCWLLSEERRAFPWLGLLAVLLVQVCLAAILFNVPIVKAVLDAIAAGIDLVIDGSERGAMFMFSYLAGGNSPLQLAPGVDYPPYLYGFRVLPTILVISALSAVLWRIGVLRFPIVGLSWLLTKLFRMPTAAATTMTTSYVLGLAESPFVLKPYLASMSRSEIYMMIVCGKVTTAGATLAAYVILLRNVLPDAATHLLVASIISAPVGELLASIVVPPQRTAKAQQTPTSHMPPRKEKLAETLAQGITDGVAVAISVGSLVLAVIALASLATFGIASLDLGQGEPTLPFLLGFVFAPLAWLMGVPWSEAHAAGGLLGTKLFYTEIVAFLDLSQSTGASLSPHSKMIMAYALSGFANIAGVAIAGGSLTALLPERREEILALAIRALPLAFLSTCMTAALIGMLPGWLIGA